MHMERGDSLSRVENQQPQDKSFQEECKDYVNAVVNALPATDKRLLEIKRAQADDANCRGILHPRVARQNEIEV